MTLWVSYRLCAASRTPWAVMPNFEPHFAWSVVSENGMGGGWNFASDLKERTFPVLPDTLAPTASATFLSVR